MHDKGDKAKSPMKTRLNQPNRFQLVDKLFMDIGEAAEYLKEYDEKLMKH